MFARVFGEPQINHAIAFEDAHTHLSDGQAAMTGMAGMSGMAEAGPVSRAVQSTLGLGTAVLVYGTALGGIFALVFSYCYGRIGSLRARGTALLVAGFGFVAMFLVPYIKYPANPPAVGSADTVGRRTALYFMMIGISVLAAVAAVLLARMLAPRLGTWNAILVAAGAYLVIVAGAGLALPAVDEVPAEFPANVLWRFRLASAGMQVVLWSTLGLLFGALSRSPEARSASRAH
ncbi:CbtA family protein [Dactylosporangium sp. CA-052675]|uniref:CbtA family protein n=1 Tax=Dactylosporangium sp. CA-052675 TaxID=3239927 RepID=UPI003D909C1E